MPSGAGASFQIHQLKLARGQSLFEKLPRGAVIRVAAGTVALVQHIRLDHTTLVLRTVMARGAVHGVRVSDCLEITAYADTELELLVPQPVALWPRVYALVARCIRALPRGAAHPASVAPRSGKQGGATAVVVPRLGV